MNIGNLLSKLSKKRALHIFFLAIVFLILGIVIYSFSVNLIIYNTDNSIKKDMRQALSGISLSINADLEKKYVYTESMSRDNAIVRSVNYGMTKGLKAYLDSNFKDLKHFSVTSTDGSILYDSKDISGSKADFPIYSSSQILFSKSSDFQIYFYFPLFNDSGKLCGSICSIHSLKDYTSILSDYLNKRSFQLYVISGGNPVLAYSPEKSSWSDKYNTDSKVKYLFFKKAINSSADILFDKTDEIRSMPEDTGIALGFPVLEYNVIHKRIPQRAFYITIAILSLLVLITFAIMISLGLIRKSKARLEEEAAELKKQKNEFIRHVDTVTGLAANNKTEALKNYVSTLGDEISIKHSLGILNNKVLSALLAGKQKEASVKNIKMEITVKAPLEKTNLSSTELCMLIGNLLDNAIEAAGKATSAERYIDVEISKDDKNYIIRVANSGDAIVERNIDRIFERGYTTKEDGENHGMGLYIVSQLAKKYSGYIKVKNTQGEVSFTVYLPE